MAKLAVTDTVNSRAIQPGIRSWVLGEIGAAAGAKVVRWVVGGEVVVVGTVLDAVIGGSVDA